jgi:DtxR family Mn-dependent transcriptional regulator
MPRTRDVPLGRVQPGQRAVLRRVRTEDPALLRHLEELGLVPGVRLKVLGHSSFDGTVRLSLKGEEITLGPAVGKLIYAEVQRASRGLS